MNWMVRITSAQRVGGTALASMIKALILHIRMFLTGMKQCFSYGLGSYVWYQGKKYFLNNGAYSAPCWDIVACDKSESHQCVSQKDMKLVKTFSNLIFHPWRSRFNFEKTNWYSIYMQNCSILECFGINYKKYMAKYFK